MNDKKNSEKLFYDDIVQALKEEGLRINPGGPSRVVKVGQKDYAEIERDIWEEEAGVSVSFPTRIEPYFTRLEYKLFQYFSRNINRTCTYREITETVWGEKYSGKKCDKQRIQKLVSRLRGKMQSKPANALFIVTVPGRGYKPKRYS